MVYKCNRVSLRTCLALVYQKEITKEEQNEKKHRIELLEMLFNEKSIEKKR